MNVQRLSPHKDVSLFVKNIFTFERKVKTGETVLPFFADGYPGLIYHVTPNGQWVQPHNKRMPVSYLYGQTLTPIELHMDGSFRIILLQLYPFVLPSFFNIDSKSLNNECFDLLRAPGWKSVEEKLLSTMGSGREIEIIQDFLIANFIHKKEQFDDTIVKALKLITSNKAQISVAELCDTLNVTVRTFERRFIKQVGISPRDFILITKFQQSLEQLTVKDYAKLSDIVYANGFSDQSHFIRVFKAFTGRTPKRFLAA